MTQNDPKLKKNDPSLMTSPSKNPHPQPKNCFSGAIY